MTKVPFAMTKQVEQRFSDVHQKKSPFVSRLMQNSRIPFKMFVCPRKNNENKLAPFNSSPSGIVSSIY